MMTILVRSRRRGSLTGVLLAGLVACTSLIAGSSVAKADITLNTSPGSPGNNVTDPLWDVTYNPGSGTVTTDTKSVEGPGYPIPPWIANTGTSDWVIPSEYTRDNAPPTSANPPINFTYHTTFSLTSDEAATATFMSGSRWASDNNTFKITLSSIKGTYIIAPGVNNLADSYTSWTAITDTGAGKFGVGPNTLSFEVYNQPQDMNNPSAFRFEGGVTAVPEPSSLLMAGAASIIGLAVARRRRNA